MASPRAIRRRTQKVLRPLKACIAQMAAETFMLSSRSLVSLREGVGLDELRLVDDLVLPVGLRLADAQPAPQVVVGVDLHVALGPGRQLDARRRGDHLVDVEAA